MVIDSGSIVESHRELFLKKTNKTKKPVFYSKPNKSAKLKKKVKLI